jgi:hypothetical protein
MKSPVNPGFFMDDLKIADKLRIFANDSPAQGLGKAGNGWKK